MCFFSKKRKAGVPRFTVARGPYIGEEQIHEKNGHQFQLK